MSKPSMLIKGTALAAAALLALSGCSSTKTESTSDNPFALKDKGTLNICAEPPYAPFEFYDKSKDLVGFDIDLGKKIAADLGAKANVVVTAFEEIQSGAALTANKCDVGIGAISINEQRKTKMDFSEPYYSDDLGFMVAKDSSAKSLDDLKGMKVGVSAGTTGADLAKKSGIDAVLYKDTGMLVQAMQAGNIQAAIGNSSTLGYTAGNDTQFAFHTLEGSGEKLGIAVKKGNSKLLDQVNKSLKEYEESGEMEKSKKKWFGTAAN